MNRQVSIYLDAWRLTLAMVVFLGHVSGERFTGGLFWQLGHYTTEAVSVFFVISGFVIGFVTDGKERDAATYVIARASRIYSVALPALLLTFILDNFGRSIRPDLYTEAWGYVANGRWWQFFSGLFFFNRVWGINVPQGSNLAYWSLGCEVVYYLIFGIITFARRPWNVIFALAAIFLAGPLTALLFPLWLLGVWSYRICRAPPISKNAGLSLFVGSIITWILFEGTASWHGHFEWAVPYRLHRPELIQDYIVGICFAANITGFRVIFANMPNLFSRTGTWIRWLAGSTFSIYLFHLPVAQFLASCINWPTNSAQTRLVVIGGTLIIVFILAEFTERRKEPWRKLFAVLYSRLSHKILDARS